MKTSHQLIGLLTAGLLIAAPACAPVGSYRGRPGTEYRVDNERRAYAQGYEAGRSDGRSDARSGRRFDVERHMAFRDADGGYQRRDGNFNAYRDNFRRGFTVGYRDAYRANERDRDGDRRH